LEAWPPWVASTMAPPMKAVTAADSAKAIQSLLP
jgi:hypothetical protein